MPKHTHDKESLKFLENTTAGRPMATPPGWLQNEYEVRTANLGRYANAMPGGNVRQANPFNLNFAPISFGDDSPRTVRVRSNSSADAPIQPTETAQAPAPSMEDLLAKWKEDIYKVYEDLKDKNNQYRSNEGLLVQLKNNASKETASKIRDLEKEQEQLRALISDLNAKRIELTAELDNLLKFSQTELTNIHSDMKTIYDTYTENEGLLKQLQNHHGPADKISQLEQTQADLGNRLQELNESRELTAAKIDELTALKEYLMPEQPEPTPRNAENRMDSREEIVTPSINPEKQLEQKSVELEPLPEVSNYDEMIKATNEKIKKLMEEDKILENTQVPTLEEVSKLNQRRDEIRTELRNLHYELGYLEFQKEKTIREMQEILDKVDEKYLELLGFINSNQNYKDVPELYSHYQYLYNQWETLWNFYSIRYRELSEKVGLESIPNMPRVSELYPSPSIDEFDQYAAEAPNKNQQIQTEAIFNYLVEHPEEYIQLLSSSVHSNNEPVDLSALVAELVELCEADPNSEYTKSAESSQRKLDLWNDPKNTFMVDPNTLAYARAVELYRKRKNADYSPIDNEIHMKERILFSRLDTLANYYQWNGKEANRKIQFVYLLNETGNKGRSIVLEQDPANNRVRIKDPTGKERWVYAFEVSLVPNDNEDVAAYIRDYFTEGHKKFHDTTTNDIFLLSLMGGISKIEYTLNGIAGFFGADVSDGRNNINLFLDDLSQEAYQASEVAYRIFEKASDAMPITVSALISAIPGAPAIITIGVPALLTVGEKYNDGLQQFNGDEGKSRFYATTIGLIDAYINAKVDLAPIQKGLKKLINKFGIEKADFFVGFVIEAVFSKPKEYIRDMSEPLWGIDPDDEEFKTKSMGTILAFIMRCIGEGDQEMLDFVNKKIGKEESWTEDDFAFIAKKMKEQDPVQKSIDPVALAPYTPPADIKPVDTIQQMAAEGTVQRDASGALVGRTFILDTGTLDASTQKALGTVDLPLSDTSPESVSESQPGLDRMQIGDLIRNAHTGTWDPVGVKDGQVYFKNKYDALVSIPQTVFEIIQYSGFSIFALDDGRLAITNGNEIVGFIYAGR